MTLTFGEIIYMLIAEERGGKDSCPTNTDSNWDVTSFASTNTPGRLA